MSSSSISRSSSPSRISRSPSGALSTGAVGSAGCCHMTRNATSAVAATVPAGTSDERQPRSRAECCSSSARNLACVSFERVAASSAATLSSKTRFARRSKLPLPSFSLLIPVLPAMLREHLAQAMHGPRIVRLHAAFRAAHGRSRLRNVEPLEVPQHECFALSRGQLLEGPLERPHRVVGRDLLQRILAARGGRLGNRVMLFLGSRAAEEAQDPRAHHAAPLNVADPVLQDP